MNRIRIWMLDDKTYFTLFGSNIRLRKDFDLDIMIGGDMVICLLITTTAFSTVVLAGILVLQKALVCVQ